METQLLVELVLTTAPKQERLHLGDSEIPETQFVPYSLASTRLTPVDNRCHLDVSVSSCFRPARVSE